MRRQIMVVFAVLFSLSILLWGCREDSVLVTDTPEARRGGRPAPSDPHVEQLIGQVFDRGLEQAALSRARNIESARGRNAKTKLFVLIDWVLDKWEKGQIADGVTESQVAELIGALYTLADLPAPAVPEGALTDDGAVQVVGSDGGVVTTGTEEGAAMIPPGALDEDVLVVIERLPDPVLPTTGPLPTNLPQYPLFFRYATFPEVVTFNEPVIVDFCQVQEGPFAPPERIHDETSADNTLRLAFANNGLLDILTPLPEPLDLVHCEETMLGMAASTRSWLGEMGMLAWKLIGPQPLEASTLRWAHTGLSSPLNGFPGDPSGAVDPNNGTPGEVVLFEASFEDSDDVIGSPPEAFPEVGVWGLIEAGRGPITVAASLGDLGGGGDQILQLEGTGTQGEHRALGVIAGQELRDDGRFSVQWSSVTGAGSAFGGAVGLTTTEGQLLASLEYETNGELAFNRTTLAAPSWTGGTAQSFEIRLDLDAGHVSLLIDNALVAGPEAFLNSPSIINLGRILIELAPGPGNVFGLDRVRVTTGIAPEAIVNAAALDFECALANYIVGAGLLGDELADGQTDTDLFDIDRRTLTPSSAALSYDCDGPSGGVFFPLSTAHESASQAFDAVNAIPDAELPNKYELLATAAAYDGYSLLLLAEGMCTVSLDGGPAISTMSVLDSAVVQFTNAIVTAATAGNNTLEQLASLGRARTHLSRGDFTAAVSDASTVPTPFGYFASYDTDPFRRLNHVYHRVNSVSELTVENDFQGLGDVRVNVAAAGTAADGVTPLFVQNKYAGLDASIPIARGAEARLIEAEGFLRLGDLANAVARINLLRAGHGLPPAPLGSAADVNDLLIQEWEREFFLEGQHLAMKRRFGAAFTPAAGTAFKGGGTYGSADCFPLPN